MVQWIKMKRVTNPIRILIGCLSKSVAKFLLKFLTPAQKFTTRENNSFNFPKRLGDCFLFAWCPPGKFLPLRCCCCCCIMDPAASSMAFSMASLTFLLRSATSSRPRDRPPPFSPLSCCSCRS